MEELAGIELPPLFHGRYNIAPTQKVAVIRQSAPSQAVESIWGFENPRSGAPVINARSETLSERPMFKDLLAANRCLIPADGFYEWKDKQPHYFQLPAKDLFAFAGLWRNNHCVVITRAATATMQGIHDRMPVMIPRNKWASWLQNHRLPDTPLPLTCRPVSRRVNSVVHDDPSCIDNTAVQIDLSLFPDDD